MFVGGRSGSKEIIRNVAVVAGLKKFNDFAEKITRPDECDILRQLYKECMDEWGNELDCVNDKLKMDILCSRNETRPDECDICRMYYKACVRKVGVDASESYCGFFKKEMAIWCSGKKDTKNADVSSSNRVESTSSNTLVRDGAIVNGLETFNDFAKKKTRPDECNIIRQQCEECMSKCGDDAHDFNCGIYRKELAGCGSKKTTKSADVSLSIFECLCLIP